MVMHGELSYLTLASEVTWGTSPGTPAFYHLPVTSYGVEMKRDRRNSQPFIGLRQRKHGRSFRGMPSGPLSCMLYGWTPGGGSMSLAELLITWGFGNPESVDLPSMLADWAEGPDVSNVRHNGLRVNSATLEGSADSGTINLNLDLMGKTESALATAQSLPVDREKIVEMDFADCTFSLGGTPILLRSFNWQVSNNLAATYLNSTAPSYLAAGQRVESLTFQAMKTADTYAAFQRAFTEQEFAGEIVVKGLHNGTGGGGSYTVGTISFPRLAFAQKQDQRSISQLIEHGLTFDVLKPDTSSNGSSVAWTTA